MIERVAFLSMHTSPLLQPGVGDAGGMNVYIDELARTMVDKGITVDVFTRCHAPGLAPVVEVEPGYRVHHIPAGPPETLPVTRLAREVRKFAEGVVRVLALSPPQVVHSHYWLSGWAGLLVKRRLGLALANSFHTLGRIKDLTRRADEPPASLLRIAAEHEVIEEADCVVASTPVEARQLLEHYGADPGRLCTSPPGVDRRVFRPGSRLAARRRLGLGDGPVVLFVGRIQPLKGVDVALEGFARVADHHPDATLLVVGGPSGPQGEAELEELRRRAAKPDLEGRVRFVEPVPHTTLPVYYRAADLLVVPSRSESFGLVAVEAQACGLPVVAARVGGLAHVVDDGRTGVLVEGWDPEEYGAVIRSLIEDPGRLAAMRERAVEWAERFSWEATVLRFLELYAGVVQRVSR